MPDFCYELTRKSQSVLHINHMLGTLDFRFRSFGSLKCFLEHSLAGISIPIFWILFVMHFFCEDSVGNQMIHHFLDKETCSGLRDMAYNF